MNSSLSSEELLHDDDDDELEEEQHEEQRTKRRTRYLERLTSYVGASLDEACAAAAMPGATDEKLRLIVQLYHNVSARIEPRVHDVIGGDPSQHYFELVAQHLVAHEQRGGTVQGQAVQSRLAALVKFLGSSDVVSKLITCLFYKWAFASEASTPRYISLVVTGCQRIFWADVEARVRTHRRIYRWVRGSLTNVSFWSSDMISFLDDLFRIVCRYCLYYERTEIKASRIVGKMKIQLLLWQSQGEILFLDEHLKSIPLCTSTVPVLPRETPLEIEKLEDNFVLEVLEIMQSLTHQHTLTRYISGCRIFAHWKLSALTSITLQSELYARTKEGSPHYLPAATRGVASTVLDLLFPGQIFSRRLVATVFRIYTQPYYAFASMYRWISAVIRSWF